MKKAYLILAHNNEEHLSKLIKKLNDGRSTFFVHIDKKSTFNCKFDDIFNKCIFINNQVSVNWGGYSIVEATNNLIKESMNYGEKNFFDFFILLSGVDYPICSNNKIDNFLELNKNMNFINVVPMPTKSKPLSRITTYYLEYDVRNNRLKGLFRKIPSTICSKLIKNRNIPKRYSEYKFYAGSQWWIFNKEFMEYLYTFIVTEQDFINFYKHTCVPDEMFYQTIIMNSPFKNTIKPSCTYTDWQLGLPPYPCIISKIHLDIIKSRRYREDTYGEHDILFARKFDNNSNEVIEMINNEILDNG